MNTKSLEPVKLQVFLHLNVLGLALWQQLSHEEAAAVKKRSPVLIQHHDRKIAAVKEQSLYRLNRPTPVMFFYLEQNRCFLCSRECHAQVAFDLGIAAHRQCIEAHVQNIISIDHIMPLQHIKTVLPCRSGRGLLQVLAFPMGIVHPEMTFSWYTGKFKKKIREFAEENRQKQLEVVEILIKSIRYENSH